MQQFNIDFFDRSLNFVHNTVIDPVTIDDDYITSTVNVIDIDPTYLVVTGQFIRVQNDEYSFFGVVTDVSPGDHLTRVNFKSFLTIFDEEVLFDTHLQGTGSPSTRPTLEALIEGYISDVYITNSDVYQRLPLSIEIDSGITQTLDWSFGFRSDNEQMHHTTVSLYSELLVKALNKYGVVVDVNPVFHDRIIHLRVTKRLMPFKISADLDNLTVKTLRYNNQTIGTNKLVVYNSTNFSERIIYYVHTDRTWDVNDRDRVTPVIQQIRIVTPRSGESFVDTALEAGYSVLSGTEWDNLIELDVYTDDINVAPMELSIGQVVSIYYKEAIYTSILTGRVLDKNKITLLFGSDRIEYTKRAKLKN